MLASSLYIVLFTVLMTTLIEACVSKEKNKNKNDDTLSVFESIVKVQFLYLGIIIIIVNFNLVGVSGESWIPVLNGKFFAFDQFFYNNLGFEILTPLIMQIITPQL